MSPLLGNFSDCWSLEAGAKPPCMVLSKAELQLWPWVGRVTFFHSFAFCFFFAVFLALSDLETSGGKNSVLFSFHTISGAIRDHALSPRLRWGFYLVRKHKHTAHSCLCTGKERAVKAGAFFIIQHQPEAPHIRKWDYTRSVSPSDSRIHCFKKR